MAHSTSYRRGTPCRVSVGLKRPAHLTSLIKRDVRFGVSHYCLGRSHRTQSATVIKKNSHLVKLMPKMPRPVAAMEAIRPMVGNRQACEGQAKDLFDVVSTLRAGGFFLRSEVSIKTRFVSVSFLFPRR